MGGGALMQLVANGSQDIYLTGNPEMTYFRSVYRRHTNFAKESILQDTVGTLKQGSKFAVTIGRYGDLLSQINVVIKRKTFSANITDVSGLYTTCLSGCSGEPLTFYYPSLGYNFLDNVEIEIGGQVIDKHYGDWLNIWTDLTESIDKKLLLNQMLYGKSARINSEYDIFNDGDIYLPLKFWFCDNPGLALPLIALQYHEVKLNFTLNPSTYASSTGTYTIDMKDCSGSQNLDIEIPIETNIIDELNVYADYIYLDTAERKKFAKIKHEYLFEQVQTQGPKSLLTTIRTASIPIRFNHPIKELVWILDNDAVNACQSQTLTIRNFEIVKSALIQLNGKNRFRKRNGTYFTLNQRYQHHSGSPLKLLFEAIFSGDAGTFHKNYSKFTGSPIPSEAIHLYSFALHPEKNLPSGSCNFSRLDNVTLELDFFNNSSSNNSYGPTIPCYYNKTNSNNIPPDYRTLWVYGINYNVLRIMSGMGGLVYCN